MTDFFGRYNREEVVRSLGKEVNINPPLTLGQLPDTPEELLKLDQVFIKSELKVGMIYVQEGQYSEEEILDNNDNSPLFEEFLQILGDKIRLKGFDKYKGGLDTVHDLTGLYSVYTNWRGIEIMFHVSTLLPYEKHDPQKVSYLLALLFQFYFCWIFCLTRQIFYKKFFIIKRAKILIEIPLPFACAASEKKTHWQRYSMRRIFGSRQHEFQSSLHQVALFAHIYLGASKSTNKAKNHEIRGVRSHKGWSWGLQTVSMGAKCLRQRYHYIRFSYKRTSKWN